MPRLVSTATKIEQLAGMLGTDHLSDWEQEFVRGLSERQVRCKEAKQLLELTDKQVDALDRLYRKHFA